MWFVPLHDALYLLVVPQQSAGLIIFHNCSSETVSAKLLLVLLGRPVIIESQNHLG